MADIELLPGRVIVLEGLDAAGKSTQSEMLRNALAGGSAAFVHMPSGFSEFSTRLRGVLDDPQSAPVNPLAQQLAHLASHADAMPQIVELVSSAAVVLDRWWWSTMAYGWYGGALAEHGVSEAALRELIDVIWKRIDPAVIFVFLDPYAEDDRNNAAVRGGYEVLAADDSRSVMVPTGSPKDVHAWIVDRLFDAQVVRHS